MKQLLKEMFSETGDISMMRVMSFMSLVIGAVLAFQGKDPTVFVIAAFGGKVAQRAVE